MSLGYILLMLVIYVLVVASLTRLINYDFITDPARLWIARRRQSAEDAALEAENNQQPAIAAEHARRQARWGWLYTLVTCPWCVSPWVGLPCAVPVVQMFGWTYWAIVPLSLAARFLVGIADRWAGENMEVVRG